MITRTPLLLLLSLLWTTGVASFGIVTPTSHQATAFRVAASSLRPVQQQHASSSSTALFMSDQERKSTTKKGTKVMDKTETKVEEKKNKEEMWRVVLHNDEVHTFNYVIRSLTKVIGTLDRKAAFEICVQTHGIGKATVTKTWKKQSEQFCLGLQRQGLTVSISPDKDFDGGHSGGGL
jgi:ATP-dependent Clp protease adapter protein ClpS